MEFSYKITERKIANEPSRNDTCLTALVQIITSKRLLVRICLMLDICLLDLFSCNHSSQLFFF